MEFLSKYTTTAIHKLCTTSDVDFMMQDLVARKYTPYRIDKPTISGLLTEEVRLDVGDWPNWPMCDIAWVKQDHA